MRSKLNSIINTKWYLLISLWILQTVYNTAVGQENLLVNYSIETNFSLDQMRSNEARDMATQTSSLMTEFEFELIISGNKALFRKKPQMARDNTNPFALELANAYCSGNQIWYVEKDEPKRKVFLLNATPSVILNLEEKPNWEITRETKMLGDYRVIKANTTRKLGTNYIEKIEAWFAPEISQPYGPIGFGGLPGLILELQRDEIVYRLKSFENKKVDISLPETKKEMPFEDYYKMLEQEMAEIKATEN